MYPSGTKSTNERKEMLRKIIDENIEDVSLKMYLIMELSDRKLI